MENLGKFPHFRSIQAEASRVVGCPTVFEWHVDLSGFREKHPFLFHIHSRDGIHRFALCPLEFEMDAKRALEISNKIGLDRLIRDLLLRISFLIRFISA